jgi:signal transduction histidine kinase
LLFEVYLSTATIAARERQIVRAFRPVTLSSLVVLLVITLPLVWGVTRRLGRAAEEREVLLRAAADASDAERRRIARDLHDTVVQDLAGTSYALSAAAQRGAANSAELAGLSESVRGSMRALRSLLVEIYPTDLHERGLAGALEDLMASASSTGVETSLHVEEVRLDDAGVGLVWRVAQESVRNALRHARAGRLDVQLRQEAGGVSLVVSDDGVGFDPEQPPGEGHFGLRGLRTLIREMGATLEVISAPGNGTTVQLLVRSR